jgi:hypothetical protein
VSKERAVRILNSDGGSFTSRRQALRYIGSGRARYIDERTIEMIESDPRHVACVASANRTAPGGAIDVNHSPAFEIVARRKPSTTKILVPYGFLHYPQRDQTTTRRRAA